MLRVELLELYMEGSHPDRKSLPEGVNLQPGSGQEGSDPSAYLTILWAATPSAALFFASTQLTVGDLTSVRYNSDELVESLPTGTVTFLFTDVEGSTAMHEADEGKARDAIERLDVIISTSTEAHGGAVILEKGEGDSHFCVFSKPTDGVQAAVEIQRKIANSEWEQGAKIALRAAVHCGEAELRGKTYYGLPVIRCARLRAVAHGGQIIISQAVRLQLSDQKLDGIALKDLGNHRLKDLQYPERIFQVEVADLNCHFPHLRSADYQPKNLPNQSTTFVGRGAEIQRIRNLVGAHRLTTIMGAGGSGKTRLSLQVAAECLDDFSGGCFFIDLIPLKKAGEIEDSIVQILQQHAGVGHGAELDREKKYLLVFDNCEHLVADAANVAERWSATYPNVSLLATSREALRVAGEVQVKLEPFAVPGNEVPFEQGREWHSVQLFEERASLRDQGFHLSEASYADVVKICRAVDGLPLAIEIAASNIDWATLPEIAGHFQSNLDSLQSDNRSIERRHRTLGAVYEWSYELLEPREKILFARLGVFPATWTIEAAAAAIRTTPHAGQCSQTVASLVRKSMAVPVEAPGPKRFRLLETLREFSAVKLGPELRETKGNIATHFASLADRSQLKLRGGEQAAWFEQFELDFPNFQLSFDFLIENNPAEALALALNIRHFLMRRSLFRPGVEWLERAISENSDGDPLTMAIAKRALAAFHWRLGDHIRATEEYESAAAVFLKLDRTRDLAATLHNLGLLHLFQGEFKRAATQLYEAADLYEGVDEPFEQTRVFLSLSRLYLDQNQPEEAATWIERAKSMVEELEDDGGMAIALGNEAEAHLQLGNLDDSLTSICEAFPLWRSVHDETAFASAAIILGVLLVRLGQSGKAAECVQIAQSCKNRTGSPFGSHQLSLIREVVGDKGMRARGGRTWEFARGVERCAEICKAEIAARFSDTS